MTSEQPSRSEILASLEHIEHAVADLRRLVERQAGDATAPAPAAAPAPEPSPSPKAADTQSSPAFPAPAPPAEPSPSASLPAFSPPQSRPAVTPATAPPASAPRRGTEQWIGANALAVIGGGAVLLGIVFFVAIAA